MPSCKTKPLLIASSLFLFFAAGFACQSLPTKSDSQPGGPEHGFLPPPVWNVSMQSMKEQLIKLEPFVFNRVEFSDLKNREFLGKEIHELAEQSKNVKHDPNIITKDPTLKFVAAKFSDEIQRADENFSSGWTEYSRWQLARATSFCIECHTRTNQGPSFDRQESTRTYLSSLSVVSQIEFLISFRQFDQAYKLALQKLRQVSGQEAVGIESDRVARLGLLISVEYMNSLEKTKALVEVISQNNSLPTYLKQDNKTWKKSLEKWDQNESFRELPQIRNLMSHRISEIEDMRAIPALLNILTVGLSRNEQGEALYLTGLSYENLNRVSIISLHENYYEACIHRAQKTEWAAKCFKRYVEAVTASYTGSSGTHIPRDVKLRIEELRNEVDGKKNIE